MSDDPTGPTTPETTPETTTAKPLYLSHSQMETVVKCPRAWYHRRIRRTPAVTSHYAVLGRAVHAAIEADFLAGWEQRQDAEARGEFVRMPRRPLSAEALADIFLNALATEFMRSDPTGLIDADKKIWAERRGLAVVQIYQRDVAPHLLPAAPPEDKFTFAHPEDPSVRFTGVRDAVADVYSEKHRRWVRAVLDWKIISKPFGPREEHVRDQAAAYLLAEILLDLPTSMGVEFVTFPLAMHHPDPSVASKANGTDGYVDMRITGRTQEALIAYSDKILATAQDLRRWTAATSDDTSDRNAFPAHTHNLCRWCEYVHACEPGQRWARDRRLPIVALAPPPASAR